MAHLPADEGPTTIKVLSATEVFISLALSFAAYSHTLDF